MKRLLLLSVILLMLSGCGGKTNANTDNVEAATKTGVAEAAETATPPVEETATPASLEAADSVTLTIYGKDKEVLGTAEVICDDDGMTVLDLLIEGTNSIELPLSLNGIGTMAYVVAIGDLEEFGNGSGSGWVFKVDGEISSLGVGSVTVNVGQTVEFYYTLDMGKDVS